MNKCDRCLKNEANIVMQEDGYTVHLCNHCHEMIMAEEIEVELEPLIESFSLKDNEGNSRTFYVERRVYPNGIFIEAFENIEFGYKFAVHGELDCNQQELLQKLIEKTRKGISKKHVKEGVFPNGQFYHSIIDDQLIGLIEYDEDSEYNPLVIIDGKPFTWEEVGKMVMSYEGFQIKITLHDFTDDVE